MTKIEYGKCEKLMEEAIRKVKQSSEEFEKAQSFFNTENDVNLVFHLLVEKYYKLLLYHYVMTV